MKTEDLLSEAATLIALLLPLYLISFIYNLIKTKRWTNLNRIKILLYSILIAFAFCYLNYSQRYYIFLMEISLVIIIIVVLYLAKLFRYPW
jgi:hypothetical protein